MGNFGKMAVMFGLGAIVGAALNAASMQDSCADCTLLPEKKDDDEGDVKPFSFKHQAVGNAKITEKVTDYIKRHHTPAKPETEAKEVNDGEASKYTPAETEANEKVTDYLQKHFSREVEEESITEEPKKIYNAGLLEVAAKMKSWGFTKDKVEFIYDYMKKSDTRADRLIEALDLILDTPKTNTEMATDTTMTAYREAQMSARDPRTTVE